MNTHARDLTGKTGDELCEQAWEAYRQAALKAQGSLDIRDGIEAGHAWARFLKLFEPTQSNVVPLRPRRDRS
jgi:hypothetical protein